MKDRLASIRRDLGTQRIVAGFRGHHQPRSPQEGADTWALHGVAGDVVRLSGWVRGAAARRNWDHDERLPVGRVVVGITDTEVLVGIAGSVYSRWDLTTAFGRVCNLHDPTWVEVGGSRLWVVGTDLDEALRIRGEVLARSSISPAPPGSSSRPAPTSAPEGPEE